MYNGLEVFWQYVEHGDCILVRRWDNDKSKVVLIDGGYKKHYDTKVKPLLKSLEIEHVDAILSTHPDQDHIGGLIRLVEDPTMTVGEAWMHRPQQHKGAQGLSYLLKQASFSTNEARIVQASMRDADDLEQILVDQGIPITEPFQGEIIQGFLHVWGPTLAFYESLVPDFTESSRLQAASGLLKQHKELDNIVARFEGKTPDLEESPQTSPENESSAITYTSYGNKKYLFTGDTGATGLTQALDFGKESGFTWMHAPHHGSRHNITKKLLDRTKPTRMAYSAHPDWDHHPHIAVRKAAKERGIKQHGTWHKHPGTKRDYVGEVPPWGSEGWDAFD